VTRSVELSDGRIAIDGVEVTGGELRQQLGPDADLVLQLSYLDPTARHALFGLRAQVQAPEPTQPTPAPSDRFAERRGRQSRGALVRFGADAFVGPDEIVTNDVVVLGGTARIEGEVDGDVVVIGGGAELGPRAHVRHDVTVVGGTLQRDPAAIVDGDVNDIGTGATIFGRARHGGGGFFERASSFAGLRRFLGLAGLAATSVRVAALILLACVLVLVVPKRIERIGQRALAEPVKAGLIGLLLELLFVPALVTTVIFLVITIIGIPLLTLVPFVLIAAAIVLLLGFTAVAHRIGELAAGRFGWSALGPYLLTTIGIAIVLAPLLLSRIMGIAFGGFALLTVPLTVVGVVVEYLVWTIGLGAAALARFRPPATA
jgi:hypothetical protein